MPETVEQRRERCRSATQQQLDCVEFNFCLTFLVNCCGDADDSVIQWHHVNEEDKEFSYLRHEWPVKNAGGMKYSNVYLYALTAMSKFTKTNYA